MAKIEAKISTVPSVAATVTADKTLKVAGMSKGSGGVSDYEKLKNLPTIGGEEVRGELTESQIQHILASSTYAGLPDQPTINGEKLLGEISQEQIDFIRGSRSYNDLQDLPTVNGQPISGELTAEQVEYIRGETGMAFDSGYQDDNGLIHLTVNGKDVEGFKPFLVKGGGGGNGAAITVTNISGWTTKAFAQGRECPFTFSWSSLEGDLSTGAGSMKITVDGSQVLNRDIEQGEITIDLAPYLKIGSHSVRVQVTDVYANTRALALSVDMIAVSLSSMFDGSTVYTGEIPYIYTPTGALTKTVTFLVDGEIIGTETVTASGRQQTYYIPAQSHGAHSLEVYFTADLNGDEIESNHLQYDLICLEADNPDPVIAIDFQQTAADQYASLVIPYRVYNPADLTASVTLSANGQTMAVLTVDRSKQSWTYRADEAGELTLSVSCGDVSRSVTLQIAAVDIDAAAETRDLALYLSSYGRSNAEANPAVWQSGEISAEFSGFNWTSDGWQTDADGISVLRVSGDARLNIPYQPFASDCRTSGKTIEVELATRDVRNYDSEILSCMSGGRGISMTAQLATLKSEQSEISMQYKDGEHLRISFVIEKRAKNRLIYCSVGGIISSVVQYPAEDDFSQTAPVGISIGSSDCAVDIYCIRVYDNDLTKEQMLSNWIADTQNGSLLLDRYAHNAVYDEYGRIVIARLPKDLPYMILEGPELPQYKGDKKTISGRYVDPQDSSRNFTFSDAQIDVQGTSSQYYARKNYKLKCKKGFVLESGPADTYALRPGSIPVNTFCFKADVASSEGCNNVELARLYDDSCPYQTPPQKENPAVRQGIDGFPMVIFWSDGNETTFLGKYNFNNDKGTEEVFGFTEGDESWETKNNTSDRVLFRNDDFSGDAWLGDFEGRYPDGNEDPVNLAAFASWVKSTDGNLQKFKAEVEDWCDLDSAIFYWLFTEIFLMVDSRAKNSFPTRFTADGKWSWLPYDFDTALGINNEGVLAFGYSLEDTDHLDGGADVFNGQQSVFWCNLRDGFGAEIAAMYQDLRSTGAISYEKVLQMFETHQAKWPEAVFNEDSQFKYLDPLITDGDAGYLSMLQGSKKSQRDWWLYNRMRYMDSKYNAGDDRTDTITLRGYAKSDVTVTPYADLYCNIKYGSVLVSQRGKRNKSYTLACPLSNVNDTEIYIYSASRLASVGDLSGLKVGYAEFSNAVKLQDLKLGDAAEDYQNANLTELHLGNNALLQTLDCRNCINLGTGSMATVDVSGCSNIEEIYLEGTAITGISLPVGGQLRVLHLPDTVTNLTIRNQKKLTDFSMSDYSGISTLRIENSSVDALDIMNHIQPNSRVRILGFAMEMDTAEEVLTFYDRLDTFRGLDENGNNTDQPQLSGSIHIPQASGAQLAEMQSRYQAIKIHADHFSCEVKYYSYDGSSLLHTETVLDGGNATYTGKPSRSSTAQYTYTFSGWSRTANGSKWTDAQKAVTTDRVLYAAYTSTVRKYTVYFYNGSTLLQTVPNVPYGGSATYSGNTSELVDPEGSGQPFMAWVPSPTNIQGSTSCKATYVSPVEVSEIEDSWDQIIANVANGSYSSKYKIGNYKELDLGDQGVVTMQIVGIDKDQKADGSGTAPLSFLSRELLKTSKRWNLDIEYNQIDVNMASWIENSTDGGYKSNNQSMSSSTAKGTFTLTPSASGTLKISYKVRSESNYDKLTVKVGETVAANAISGDVAWTDYDVEVTAGTAVVVEATYTKDSSGDQNGDTAYVKWSGVDVTCSAEITQVTGKQNTSIKDGTGTIGGWENSELRTYYKNTLKPLIPETVRNAIVSVTKTHPAYRKKENDVLNHEQFTQTTTEDVWCPSYAEMFQSTSNGGIYRSIFTDNASRVKSKVSESSASWWWLRSAHSSNGAYYVNSSGSYNSNYVNNSGALALGFCL